MPFNAVAVLGVFLMCAEPASSAEPSSPSLVQAAREFLESLDPEQREEAQLPFNSEARLDWHYVPRERPGLSFKKMREDQKEKALDVMRAALSRKGFEKTETIRALDEVLRALEGRDWRDPELYDVAVFGEPSDDHPWGLRYEGHHISLNWTFTPEGAIASTPQFLGANPAEVQQGPMQGTRALAAEEDLARALVKSLDDGQRGTAVLSDTAPREILTGAEREASIQEDRGLAYADMNEDQQGLLLSLIREYADAQPAELAEERLAKIRAAGLDAVKFAWMGGLEQGQGHYYRIQGPTFLIEYDNTQNNANHIHTVWRDFDGDFGRDILKEHYEAHAAPGDDHGHDH